MAVAVKNSPEIASSGAWSRLPVVSLAGVVYILGCLGIVFKLIPALWWSAWEGLGLGPSPFVGPTLLGLVMLAAVSGLIVLGAHLLGPRTPDGTRAGIFVGLVGLLMILLLTRWASLWIEHWVFDDGLFGGTRTAGAVATGVVGLILLALGVWLFVRKDTEKQLLRVEHQGWFYGSAYKPGQGLRVRRGTMFGILVMIAAGVWTLMAHGTLRRGDPSWQIAIPFTGREVVEDRGDVPAKALPEPGSDGKIVVDRFALRDINNEYANPGEWIKVRAANGSDRLKAGDVIKLSDFEEERRRLKEQDPDTLLPEGEPPQPATGPVLFEPLTLLPAVQFTVPLLLLGLALWLAWRIVNMPTFADFLIATEAELNKVSWTTRRRLVQDTIVVLLTVILMAFYLFAMDQCWRVVLSWKPIGVIQLPENQSEANTSVEQKRY